MVARYQGSLPVHVQGLLDGLEACMLAAGIPTPPPPPPDFGFIAVESLLPSRPLSPW